jgi:hypothetical protein
MHATNGREWLKSTRAHEKMLVSKRMPSPNQPTKTATRIASCQFLQGEHEAQIDVFMGTAQVKVEGGAAASQQPH